MRAIPLLCCLAQPRLESVITWERAANNRCRGGSYYQQPTWQACGERDAYGRVLHAMGWCYGRCGEIGAEMNWHRCETNSNRPRSSGRQKRVLI